METGLVDCKQAKNEAPEKEKPLFGIRGTEESLLTSNIGFAEVAEREKSYQGNNIIQDC